MSLCLFVLSLCLFVSLCLSLFLSLSLSLFLSLFLSFSLCLSLDIHITSPENEDGGNKSKEVRKTKLGDNVAGCQATGKLYTHHIICSLLTAGLSNCREPTMEFQQGYTRGQIHPFLNPIALLLRNGLKVPQASCLRNVQTDAASPTVIAFDVFCRCFNNIVDGTCYWPLQTLVEPVAHEVTHTKRSEPLVKSLGELCVGPKTRVKLSTHLTAVVVASVTVHRREGVRVPSAGLSQKSTCSTG